MGRSGTMLPVALAVLSGCLLPRGRALQKFGAQRAELEGLRAEVGAERAQTRVRADAAGSLELFEGAEQVVATRARAAHRNTQMWDGDPATAASFVRSLNASLVQTVQEDAATSGITSDSAAGMNGRLEDKIAATTAAETEREHNSKEGAEAGEQAEGYWKTQQLAEAERVETDRLVMQARLAGKARLEQAKRRAKEQFDQWQMDQARSKQERLRQWRVERRKNVLAKLEAERKAKEEAVGKVKEKAEAKAREVAERAPTAVSSPERSLKDIRRKLYDSIAALPNIPEAEPARKALQRQVDAIVKQQLEGSS